MEEKSVHVPKITCGHCVARIVREIGQIQGVVEVDGNPEAKVMRFRWEAPASWEAIRAALAGIGYPPLE